MSRLIDVEHREANYNPQTTALVDFEPTFDYHVEIKDIRVYWAGGLDGGGNTFGLAYPQIIRELYPNRVFEHCFEWCAGPGFIGYALYVQGLCKQLTLSDIYRPSLRCAEYTRDQLPAHYDRNPINIVHTGDCADLHPEKKFDLIVSNPPHWNWNNETFSSLILDNRINADPDWRIHRNFFNNIKRNLAEDGIILLQEQSWASGPATFESMINESGLKINRCLYDGDQLNFWYLEVTHA